MRHASPSTLAADINITPLVDIMLVLLIIFMVVAPLLDQGIPVDLPGAATGNESPDSGLVLTLTGEHLIYLNEDLVTVKDLPARLRAAGNQPVFIRADRHAYVSKLVDLWDLCREQGFRQVHIMTITD
jgi:biopolymer transport protein ExbD